MQAETKPKLADVFGLAAGSVHPSGFAVLRKRKWEDSGELAECAEDQAKAKSPLLSVGGWKPPQELNNANG